MSKTDEEYKRTQVDMPVSMRKDLDRIVIRKGMQRRAELIRSILAEYIKNEKRREKRA